MRLTLMIFLTVLYLGLLTGCDDHKKVTHPDAPSVTTTISVDTMPLGVGMSVVGGGMVVAAWINTLMGGRHD